MPDGRLWPKAKKIRDANRFVFEYNFGSLTTLKDLVSTQKLQAHAQNLIKALRSTEKPARYVLLVGYGYGGLICEQVRWNSLITFTPSHAVLQTVYADIQFQDTELCLISLTDTFTYTAIHRQRRC